MTTEKHLNGIPSGIDTKAFQKISYGVYIVASSDGSKLNGQIANTVFQVTSEPAQIAISINKGNLTHDFISKSKRFTLSTLSESAPMPFIGTFGFKSGREVDKFKGVKHKLDTSGVPVVLDYAVSFISAEVVNSLDCGTHTVFIGRVTEAEVLSEETPMTYSYYHTVKNGLSPKSAPTYAGRTQNNEQAQQKEAKTMKKYKCTVCGYIYDPAIGDPESGIKPGTAFENIPADWVCPTCGVGKDSFDEVN